VLVKYPAIVIRDVQVCHIRGFLWSSIILTRIIPCELIRNVISTCTRIFRDRDEAQRLEISLLYQWGSFESLKGFHGYLTVRGNTKVFL
jgi:hypothetical protein